MKIAAAKSSIVYEIGKKNSSIVNKIKSKFMPEIDEDSIYKILALIIAFILPFIILIGIAIIAFPAFPSSNSAASGEFGGMTDYGGSGELVWPVPSSTRISSPYGGRIHPISGTYKFHSGIDLTCPTGTQVAAAAAGTVTYAQFNSGGYGYLVKIDHGNGVQTYYAHNSALNVNVGDKVEAGQVIALSGNTGNSTGPHLHFEVRVNNDTKNPLTYLN